MKTIITAACCFMMTTCIFAQQGKSVPPPTASTLIGCLQTANPATCLGTPPIIPYNPILLRGVAAPSLNATDFVNYFACSYSVASGASTKDASQILLLSQKKMPFSNLSAYLKANPASSIAVSVQQLLSSSSSYEAFQNGLSQLYTSLNNQTEKDFVFSLSNSMEFVGQSAAAGNINKSASCSGWWSCWGQCAGSILGGALASGLTGAVSGTAIPVIGTAAGGIIGAVAGGISGALSGCN